MAECTSRDAAPTSGSAAIACRSSRVASIFERSVEKVTMNRRRFLRRTSAAAASSLAAGLGFDIFSQPARADGCGAVPPAVQLYTVRDALARDARAAVAALREIGIVEAELFGLNGPESATSFGLPAPELRRLLDANGIRVPLSHVGGALTNTAAIADIARTLGIGTLVVALPSEFSAQRDGRFTMVPAESRAQLDALASKLERVGREYRDRGLTFGYHNHHVEFLPVDGVVPFDYLMSSTDPALVKIELDVGWLAYAGVDPVAQLRRYAGRVIACHLKDYDSAIAGDVPQRKLVEPGAGTIDFAAVLAAMRETGVRHGFIEIDLSDDPLGAVRRGREHLRAVGACA
jgi:sugar phosphate isomerase/epimerase